jgi:hypothetical protein
MPVSRIFNDHPHTFTVSPAIRAGEAFPRRHEKEPRNHARLPRFPYYNPCGFDIPGNA